MNARHSIRAASAGALVALGTGCGHGPAGELGTYEPDAGPRFVLGDSGGASALDAHIEENHVAVTFVTLGTGRD